MELHCVEIQDVNITSPPPPGRPVRCHALHCGDGAKYARHLHLPRGGWFVAQNNHFFYKI